MVKLMVIAAIACTMLTSFQQATHIEATDRADSHHIVSIDDSTEQHNHPDSGFHDCHSCAHHHSMTDIAKMDAIPVPLAKQAEIVSRDSRFTSRLSYPPSRPPKA